jgi:hypothetical protein
LWSWGMGRGMLGRFPASKLLARRFPLVGRPLRWDGATKFTARPRRLKPVDERLLFFSKSSGAGTVPLVDLFVMAISSGDPGDGGELERVVLDDLFIENRRPLGGGPVATDGVPAREMSDGGAESVTAEEGTFEFERRKIFDSDRLKLPVEPRVGRRESGVGGGSCCWDGVCEPDDGAVGADVGGGTEVGGLEF